MSKPSRGAAGGRSCWVRPRASGTAGPYTTRGGSFGRAEAGQAAGTGHFRQAQPLLGPKSTAPCSPGGKVYVQSWDSWPHGPRAAGHLEAKSMYGSGCKGSSRISMSSSHSQRCWHLLPLWTAGEERDMRHRMGTTEITLTAALAKLWLSQPCSFLPAENSGAEPAATPKAALLAWKRAVNAVPSREL